MQSLATILLCILSAIVYGILHDQITARICVEYFTIGHPSIFDTDDPTLLGIGWGIWATWWVGLLLGVPLVAAARAGSRPKRDVRSLVRPIAILLALSAVAAVLAGLLGWVLASQGMVVLPEPLASRVPREKQIAFIADWWAHSCSYLAGFYGGFIVVIGVWRSRSRCETDATS